MRKALTVAVCVLFVASARDAAAQAGQPWTDRGYVNLSVGVETTSGSLTDARTFPLYDENATFNTSQSVDSGALFDFAIGARVWRNVSAGIAFHRESTTAEGSIQAQIPNPSFFGPLRPVDIAISDLERSEQAVHLQIGYMLPVSEQLNVHLFLGPSFFRLKQDVISDLTFTERTSPATTLDSTATVEERSESAVGFNIGADVSYLFYTTDAFKVGAGIFLRYAGATVDINLLNNSGTTVGSDVGGFQIGFGGRFRF